MNFSSKGRLLRFRVLSFSLLGICLAQLLYSVGYFFVRQQFWDISHVLKIIVLNIHQVGLQAAFALLMYAVLFATIHYVSQRLGVNSLVYVLSTAGYGILLLLIVILLKLHPSTALTFGLLVAPLALSAAFAFTRPGPMSQHHRSYHIQSVLPFSVMSLMFATCLATQINRPPAHGDETTFWYTAAEMVRFHGFDYYLKNHPYSNYDPGYPLLCGFMTWLFPPALFQTVVRIVPFLFGIAICGFVVSRKKPVNTKATWVALLLLTHLFFINWRVHFYFFHAWGGKALVVLSLLALFKTVDEKSRWTALGVAALAQSIKPPLAILLVFYILTAMPICVGLARKSEKTAVVWTFVFMLLGSIAVDSMWAAVRPIQDKIPTYALGAQTLVFNPHILFTRLIPFLLWDHAPYVGSVGLTVLMGLLWPRQFTFPLLILLFMTTSIFFIFLMLSPLNRDYYAGVRYLFQGFYGWQCYFLYMKWGVLTRCLKW